MNAAVLLLLLWVQFGYISDFVQSDFLQSGTQLSGNQGRPIKEPTLLDMFGLDNNPDALGAAWDLFFGLEPEVTMDTMERILYNGYPAESHTATTQDGNILQIHRIPANGPAAKPVLLVHGTFTSADCWLGNVKENNLAFILADAGLDVWLINLRGCQNSLGHTTFDSGPFSKDYWQFSFDEMAKYDLPACVDHILQTTGQPQLYLIGHSLGGGVPIFFVADRPEYNQKVKTIFSLAPLGNLGGFQRKFEWMQHFDEIYKILTQMTSMYELYLPISKRTIGTVVKMFTVIRELTSTKKNPDNENDWNSNRLPNLFASGYSSTSFQLIHHYDQFIRDNGSKGIRHYNWGEDINMVKYRERFPPLYNLSAVRVPVHLYRGGKDTLVPEQNVRHLKDRLPNVASYNVFESWDHCDFIWSRNAPALLFKPMLEIIMNDN